MRAVRHIARVLPRARSTSRERSALGARRRGTQSPAPPEGTPARNAERCDPYSRVLGARNGCPVSFVVQRDGSVHGDHLLSRDDPLEATLAAARACDHVTTVAIFSAGWRSALLPVPATAQWLDGEGERLEAERMCRQILEEHDRVIGQLFAAGLEATTLQRKMTDSETQLQLERIIEGLNVAIADLRATVFQLAGSSPSTAMSSTRTGTREAGSPLRPEL